MSILIKGIDMPKGDEIISLVIASDKWCAGFNEKYERIDAQAIPVLTPHGRLVEEKVVIENLLTLKAEMDGTVNAHIEDIFSKVYNAPTVIEAEEQESEHGTDR